MKTAYNPHLGYEADIVRSYERMVHSVVRKFRSSVSAGIDYADLVSVGTIGLIAAFRNYDPERFNGRVTSFATYAFPMIKWEIQRYLRDRKYLVRIPRAIQALLTAIRKNGWEEESAEVIAEKGGWKLSEVQEVLKHLSGWSVASLDQPLAVSGKNGDEVTMLDLFPSTSDFSGVFVQEFISLIEQHERVVLDWRLQGQTQSQIAQSIGKSQVHICRILKQIGDKYIQYQAGTLKREGAHMGRNQGLGSKIEWFVDEAVPTNPTVGLNGHGFHLNRKAVQEIGCKAGQCVQVGFDPEEYRLLIQLGNKGLQLRTTSGDKNGGLRVVNKRLSSWLDQKKAVSKRYALQADPDHNLFFIQLERHV